MRLASVLEPDVIYADPAHWSDEHFVADFERRLVEVVDVINDANQAGCDQAIPLSDTLLALIFGGESAPAWMLDRAGRQRLIPIVSQRLLPLVENVVAPSEVPVTVGHYESRQQVPAEWLEEGMALLSWALSNADRQVIHVGCTASEAIDVEVVTVAGKTYHVPRSDDRTTFLRVLPYRELAQLASGDSLAKLTDLMIDLFVAVNPDRSRVYAYRFSSGFLAGFEGAPAEMRLRSLEAVVSRITQNQKSAQADKGLQDKPISGRDGWRRMRVSRDWRIHYTYTDGPGIVFETLGVHDLGLR